MKRVELFTIVSGPRGTAHPGEIVLLEDKEADQLVAAHCARFVGKDGKPVQDLQQEQATAPAAAENAAGRRKAKKRTRRKRDQQP